MNSPVVVVVVVVVCDLTRRVYADFRDADVAVVRLTGARKFGDRNHSMVARSTPNFNAVGRER